MISIPMSQLLGGSFFFFVFVFFSPSPWEYRESVKSDLFDLSVRRGVECLNWDFKQRKIRRLIFFVWRRNGEEKNLGGDKNYLIDGVCKINR